MPRPKGTKNRCKQFFVDLREQECVERCMCYYVVVVWAERLRIKAINTSDKVCNGRYIRVDVRTDNRYVKGACGDT